MDVKSIWVDSVYSGMSPEEKVGQLFMIATYSNRAKQHADSIERLIRDHHIGGLIFFQGGPVRQARLTNEYQAMSKLPLLIGMDAEWGLKMRLDSTPGFPYNMTLGAIENDSLIRRIGIQIGRHCKRMGVHLNYAPVVDINTNALNPIIGVRSFGEDKLNVTKKAIAFTNGLQSQGVLACAKHFPGHGDTDQDSHKSLPAISFSRERIDSVELYPYKKLFEQYIAGVMVAHLSVPSLESNENLPSSLSYNIVSNLLKEQLSYTGLIITDALNMKGAANYKAPGEIELEAFMAGNDILSFSENAPKAISRILKAYDDHEITEERLAHSVKKILAAKYDAGLHHFTPVNTKNLVMDLNGSENTELNKLAYASAITTLKNEGDLLPVGRGQQERVAYIKLGDGKAAAFISELKSQLSFDDLSGIDLKNRLQVLNTYDKVIIGYHRANFRRTNVMSEEDKRIIESIAENTNVILNVFASQYALGKLDFENIEGVVVSYENNEMAQEVSAQIILGNGKTIGVLPASVNKTFTVSHAPY